MQPTVALTLTSRASRAEVARARLTSAASSSSPKFERGRLWRMLPLQSVLLDREASVQEVTAVTQVLHSRGFEPNIRAEWQKDPRSGNGAFWIVLITIALPVRDFLKSFTETLGKKAGESSWESLKSLIDDLRAARRESTVAADGWIELDDPEGTKLMVAAIPNEAYQRLLEIDWSHVRGGTLMWHDQDKEWFDPSRKYGQ